MNAARRLLRLLLGLLLCGLLVGCALRPSAPVAELREVAAAQWMAVEQPASWQLRGRAALAIDDEGGTASLIWRQSTSDYQIDLRGALGAGSLRLQGDSGGVVLTTAGGERYAAQDARTLLAEVGGYDLPVDYLRHWLMGQPVPGLGGRLMIDPEGKVRLIQQAEWEVRLSDYQMQAGFYLPRRITASGQGARLTLLVRDWTVGR